MLVEARDILDELGVHVEASANEAGAAAMLGASINYPLRGAVTWKSTVGTNVASDALSNLASAGVMGGALIVLGEDYGEGASIIQERTHAFALKSQMWLLDPRPEPADDRARWSSRASSSRKRRNTPVMLELRIRACHVHGSFVGKDNRAPAISTQARCSTAPISTTTASACRRRPTRRRSRRSTCAGRRPSQFIARARAERVFRRATSPTSASSCQGGLYNALIRALQQLGLADAFGASRVPLSCSTSTYPLVPEEIVDFCAASAPCWWSRKASPNYIEQAIAHHAAPRRHARRKLHGKDLLPMAGEYTGEVVLHGLARFLDAACRPASMPRPVATARSDRPSKQARPPSCSAAAAGAPAGLLHRLPRAAGVLGDEAARSANRQGPHLGRHRLPHVRDAPPFNLGQHRCSATA